MTSYNNLVRRAWPILIEAARMRRTLPYSELAGRVGPPLTARAVHRQLLTPLSERARRFGLPDLAALVVRKGSGLPGGGWFDPATPGDPVEAWADAVAACYAFPWTTAPDPAVLDDD